VKNPLHHRRAKLFTILALFLVDAFCALTGFSLPALILTAALFIYAFVFLTRLVLHRSRLIWRLRDRLIVTYLFMGAVPILLILALAYSGAYIVVGQVAAYLVSSELNRRALMLENPARVLAQSTSGERADILKEMAPLLRGRAPDFRVLVTGDGDYRYPAGARIEAPPAAWKSYTGTMYKDGAFYSLAICKNGPITAVVLAPLRPSVLQSLVPGIGNVALIANKKPNVQSDDARVVSGDVPPAYSSFDFEYLWVNPMNLAYWNEPNSNYPAELTVTTRPSAVLSAVFGDRVDSAQDALQIFILFAFLLAIVQIVSIVIGVSMIRAITGAVANLYNGTLSIGRGDFTLRIPVKGRDQLASLGKSFNQMSEQLEKLVAVAKEKERLQSELAIASEVQNQLFPRATPAMRTIQLTGSCEPARSVSGDYYDYISLPNGNLAIAVGDVAGKGISAALLMASIQSIMRTQLAQGVPMAAAVGNGRPSYAYSTSGMVAQLNRQLYESTAPEKYATFFFGIYDESSRILTYTNAGHLSPLLICGGKVSSLEVTGTVVGLFPNLAYQEQNVRICANDLLIAYTDGITEPENAYGEEFGAERLAEQVLKNQNAEPSEIVAKVMESVKHWSGAPELPDDMTVVIARGIK
jgi:sigma-B regulation protein RsbU (phosphoserine phosphatase)